MIDNLLLYIILFIYSLYYLLKYKVRVEVFELIELLIDTYLCYEFNYCLCIILLPFSSVFICEEYFFKCLCIILSLTYYFYLYPKNLSCYLLAKLTSEFDLFSITKKINFLVFILKYINIDN